MLRKLLKACVLPPLMPLLIAAVGAALWRRRPRLSRWLVFGGLGLLWLLATPAVAALLLRSHQVDAALDPAAAPRAGAIVVLSADLSTSTPEYGEAGIGAMTLQRVRYAAWLHERTGAPILVSGRGRSDTPTLAELMRRVLAGEFGVEVRWLEPEAGNTFENATRSAALLLAAGVDTVYLVTHAWHMPRARACFEAAGLRVVAAPTGFRAPAFEGFFSLVPSWSAVRDSALGLHEWFGRAWYDLRHY